MADARTDRNLLFAVLAFQADLIDQGQFVEACNRWAARKDTPLADILVEQGWLGADERRAVDLLLERRLRRHEGNVHATLAGTVAGTCREALAEIDDPAVRQAVAELPSAGPVLLSTLAYHAGSRERYTLSRLHARGGIGQVWLARDGDLGREVALKELQADRADSPAAWARFLDEARITGQLEHPGIVPVYELVRGGNTGKPFYTMRFLRGQTLAEAVRAYHRRRAGAGVGPLELRELLTAFVAVCNAVAYAHSRGVLHRDLKPQNVVLGGFGEVMVLDWGLAKLVADKGAADGAEGRPLEPAPDSPRDATQQGQVLGTPSYMAPEQADGRPDLVDARSDVYGLGAILYEILTGRPPYEGAGTEEVLRRVLQEAPAAPRRHATDVPPALEAVCLKALARDRAGRYASARELAHEVERWLAGEPVTAYPEPWPTQARRWLGRHRALTAATAAGLVVATGTLLAATLLLKAANDRERAARARAEDNFGMARAAVDHYFTLVSESAPLKAHGLERLRQDLLREARAFYEQFSRTSGAAPDVEAGRGQSYSRLALIDWELGNRPQALATAERARDLFIRLVETHPDRPEFRVGLLEAEHALARFYHRTARLDDARRTYEVALREARDLASRYPGVADYEDRLARVQGDLGIYYLDVGLWEPAREALEAPVAQFERRVRERPDDPDSRHLLATALFHLGSLHRVTGKRDEARAAFDRSLAQRRELARGHVDHPLNERGLVTVLDEAGLLALASGDLGRAGKLLTEACEVSARLTERHHDVPDFLDLRGRALHDLGAVQLQGGDGAAALRSYRAAYEVFERLARDFPDVPAHQFTAAVTLGDIGALHQSAGELGRAREAFEKTCALLEPLARKHASWRELQERLTDSRFALLGVRAQLGDYAVASREADALVGMTPDAPGALYDGACVQSLASAAVRADARRPLAEREQQAARFADRAMTLLRKAVGKGYRNVTHLKTDSDLRSLHGRPDFAQLIVDLEKTAR